MGYFTPEVLTNVVKFCLPIALLTTLQRVDIRAMGLFGVLEVLFALSFAFCVVLAFYMRALIKKAPDGDEKVDLRNEETGKSAVDAKITTVAEHDRTELVKHMLEMALF